MAALTRGCRESGFKPFESYRLGVPWDILMCHFGVFAQSPLSCGWVRAVLRLAVIYSDFRVQGWVVGMSNPGGALWKCSGITAGMKHKSHCFDSL